MSLSAVLFDLDGTLADTITDISNAVNVTLQAHGYPTHPIESYKLMVGNGFRMLMQRALPQEVVIKEEVFAKLVVEASERYQAMSLDTTVPFPGTAQTLSELASRRIKIGVLSNKPDALTKMLVNTLFPGIPFVAIEGDLPGKPRKPDPSRALEMLEKAAALPQESAFVGDSGVDMETARNGKMLPLGASWGYRSIEELQEYGAQVILAEPADILRYLD
jgi:phosphoglycolate phosphatase